VLCSRPVGVLVCLFVKVAGYIWPAIVSAWLEPVEFIVALVAVLYDIEVAGWAHRDALVVAVPVGKDVALHAFYLRVVVGYRAVRVHPKYLALVYVGPVLGVYLLLRWEKLCPDWHAVAAELVVALVAYCVI